MRIIECDRCHKKVTDPEKVGHVRISWHSARTDELITAAESYDWDFCDECMQEIEEFVRSKKKETVKPAETKKKQIDTGRIKALHKAGWSIRKIAEDIGCSEPTVRKYIDDNEGISKSDKTAESED